ncbi:MAG: hypothetical protein U0350_43800 [Caldilineaceae bacterium]
MQIDILVYVHTERCLWRRPFVPPSTGLRLAALTPVCHQVCVIHPPIESVRPATKADLVCLLFSRLFVKQAYQLAAQLAVQGKLVVMGGSFVTRHPEEALEVCEAVLIGAIEPRWLRLLMDANAGQLQRYYKKEAVH